MDFIFTSPLKRLIVFLLFCLPGLGRCQAIADGLIYSLPKSEFTLLGTVRTTQYTPGPLATYAKKYLGIQAKEMPETIHQITQSKLILNLLPDTACLYLVPNAVLQQNRFNFGRGSMLLTVNSPNPAPQHNQGLFSKSASSTGNTDLPVLPMLCLTQETDTIYRRELLADSVVVEHWEIQTLIQQQTTEEIAKSTAQKLVQLEQDRQQLLRFNEDVQYSGPALRVMLQRLDSLERYYHELFQGRQTHRMTAFSFPLSLSNSELADLQLKGHTTKVIAGFSADAGFTSDTSQALPLVLSIQGLGLPQAMRRFIPEKAAKSSEGLLLRIPDRCTMQISLGNTLLIRENQPLFQLGTLVRIPLPKSGILEYSIWPELGNPDSVEW